MLLNFLAWDSAYVANAIKAVKATGKERKKRRTGTSVSDPWDGFQIRP
jgi:hypothetical protein